MGKKKALENENSILQVIQQWREESLFVFVGKRKLMDFDSTELAGKLVSF